VGRLGIGPGIRVSASFQTISRPVSRLGLELGLGSEPRVVGRLGLGPRVMGRLGSGVLVSASFQIFALTAGECHRWGGKLFRRRKCPGKYVRGGNVLHSIPYSYMRIMVTDPP